MEISEPLLGDPLLVGGQRSLATLLLGGRANGLVIELRDRTRLSREIESSRSRYDDDRCAESSEQQARPSSH
jgi:hypothetical protein